LVAAASTSEDVRMPVAVAVPATASPASVTLPAFAAAALVTTGASFVPLIVTVTVWSTLADWSSVARTTKVSVTVWPSLSACVVSRLLSRT
jgi:Na+-translocating ferredoxin:NAD+ oxidoreductase RnfE subunit